MPNAQVRDLYGVKKGEGYERVLWRFGHIRIAAKNVYKEECMGSLGSSVHWVSAKKCGFIQ